MFETETSASPEPDDVWHSMLTKGRKQDTPNDFYLWDNLLNLSEDGWYVQNAPLCVFKVQQHTVLLPHVDESAADNEPQHLLPVSRKSQRKLHVRDLFNYYLWGPLHLHMTG